MYRLLRTRHRWWNRWVLVFVSSVENPSPQSTTMEAGRGMSDHLSRYPYDSFISCGKRYSIMSPLFPSAALLCQMKCSIDSKLSSVKCMLWLSWDFQVNFDVSIFLCQHALGKPYCIKHSFSKLGVLHLNIKTLIQFHLHDIITLLEFFKFPF